MINKKQQTKNITNNDENNLDLSSIQDDNSGQYSNHSSDIDIQEMGAPMASNFKQECYNQQEEDQVDFRNHVKQLLITQRQYGEQDGKKFGDFIQQEQDNQFSGEPLKGSFLRDMEILGKTMSFESTCYNIYQGICQNSNILSEINGKTNQTTSQMLKFIQSYRLLQKNTVQIEAKYIIDFTKSTKQKSSKCKRNSQSMLRVASKSKQKKVLTDCQTSTKSISSNYTRTISQMKSIKCQNKVSKKNHKFYQQFIRKSDISQNIRKGNQYIASPLKKVGIPASTIQINKNKNLVMVSAAQKYIRKKKVEQKVSIRAKK